MSKSIDQSDILLRSDFRLSFAWGWGVVVAVVLLLVLRLELLLVLLPVLLLVLLRVLVLLDIARRLQNGAQHFQESKHQE